MPSQEQNVDDRCRKVAKQIRKVIFKEFGPPEKMSEAEMDACMRTMIAIYTGELIEFAARFCKDVPVREGCIRMVDAMLNSNVEEVARLKGRADRREYLVGETEH